MSDWQPIETAPKDGPWILVWDGVNTKWSPCEVAQWRTVGRQSFDKPGWYDGDIRLIAASHWQPLPLPPVKEPS